MRPEPKKAKRRLRNDVAFSNDVGFSNIERGNAPQQRFQIIEWGNVPSQSFKIEEVLRNNPVRREPNGSELGYIMGRQQQTIEALQKQNDEQKQVIEALQKQNGEQNQVIEALQKQNAVLK